MKKILTVIIIGLLGFSMFSILAPQAKATSLPPVGYWKFDEGSGTVAGDSSGNGNTGTLMNGPQWVAGIAGTALGFDGVDDSVDVPTSASIAVQGNQVSLECWIKPTTTLDASHDAIINIIDKGDEYTFQMNPNDGRIWFAVILEPGPQTNWQGITTTTEQWIADTWYHLTGTYDGSYLRIYVNGVPQNSRPLSGNLFAPTSWPLTMGAHSSGDMNYFFGSMDEIKIYNYARTPEEVWNDYTRAKLLVMFDYSDSMIDQAWSFPNGATFTFRGWLQSKGYSVATVPEAFPAGEITLSGLQSFQAVLALGDFFENPANIAYVDTVVQYVSLGGGLVLFGQHSHPAITIDEAFGFKWIGSAAGPVDPWSFYVDARITDYSHQVMEGIIELPKAGGVFIDWDTLIDETPLPSGTAVLARTIGSGGPYDPIDRIAMIAFQYGAGKVIVGPWDGLVRPYGPTAVDPWNVIAEPVIENKLLINAINWVSQAIVNQPPVAQFRYRGPDTSFTPSTIYVGSEVKFDAEPSYDPDGTIVRYTWNFGDRTIITKTDKVAYHVYPISGPYTVTLTVTDDKGATGEISKDIFIYPLQWELFIEIDYMIGHRPTDPVLEYIRNYYRDNGIRLTFSMGTEFSNIVTDPTPGDNMITRSDFWVIEAGNNDFWKYDDRASGSEIIALTKLNLKEKWVLFGTTADPSWLGSDAYGGIFNVPYVTDTAANYIFIPDQHNDQKAEEWTRLGLGVTTEEIETQALMHEIGHSIGITLWDWPPWNDQDRDGTRENYDDLATSVMSFTTPANCNAEPISYSKKYWKLRNMEYYTI